MRRHAAAGSSRAFLRYLRGDGVEALATVARDAAAARRALATTTATTTTRDLTSDAPSSSSTSLCTVRASPFVASWRGFAAAGARRPVGGGYDGGGGGRGGRGAGLRAPGKPFNTRLVNSASSSSCRSRWWWAISSFARRGAVPRASPFVASSRVFVAAGGRGAAGGRLGGDGRQPGKKRLWGPALVFRI